ncbi:MAG: family 43 glycosylhydrolase [Sedimentisphaerales bacterium]|nr:family 43 glycosylhydrolase [Sedimentisphaerales bacterium]
MVANKTHAVFCVTIISFITIFVISGCSTIKPITNPEMLELHGQLGVHDPVIMREGNTYYIFSTGRGRGGIIPIKVSKDLHNWKEIGCVFSSMPEWTRQEIPRSRDAWAPDISYFNGKYHLYYSVSSFGVNDSAIGLATNKTLDPNSPDYKWEDQGLVVRSTSGETDWNAIDGNIVIENKNKIWLCWGSFWSGIKMRRIDPETGKLLSEDTTLYSLCERERSGAHQTPPSEGAVEAPFIIKHGKYWYLFVSFDFCCRGVRSTYNVRVGRSREVAGPYFDKEDKAMLEGGGSIVIQTKENAVNWAGPGHPAVLQEKDSDYLVFHAYSIPNRGSSMLNISTMAWEDGWPRVAELP